MALLLKNSFAAQSALDLTSSWARDLRLKLNVGDDKTAALCGPSSGCPSPTPLSVDGVPLPSVTTYRYLGGLLHCAGSVRPTLKDLDLRLTKRTGMFVRWDRASQIAIAILAKLFIIYLELVALSLLAAVPLNASDLVHIDMLQRKLTRMVWGHGIVSYRPSPLLLLGWCSCPRCSRLYVLASSCVLILGCLPCALCFVSLGHGAKARGTIKLPWAYAV